MLPSTLEIAGEVLVPHGSGALYWPRERTLLVADLHLEKGAAFASRGAFLPPYDTRTTLRRLGEVIAAFAPRRVVALGDSFHTAQAAYSIGADDLAALRALQGGRDWCWITGNHDPHLPRTVGGTVCEALRFAGIALRHEPSGTGEPEIAGHLHPVARTAWRGESIRRRCFATDGRRLVLPALGAFTGGLNVLDEAFTPLFPADGLAAWMLGRTGVYPILGRWLLPDRAA